jgi:hypothetical protein
MQAAAEGGYSLPHANQAKPRACRPGAVAVAVVVDLDRQGVWRVLQAHRRARLAGVTAHVGEGFLDDPVSGLIHAGREGPLSAGHGHRTAAVLVALAAATRLVPRTGARPLLLDADLGGS